MHDFDVDVVDVVDGIFMIEVMQLKGHQVKSVGSDPICQAQMMPSLYPNPRCALLTLLIYS